MTNDNDPRRPAIEDARQRKLTLRLLMIIAVLAVILIGMTARRFL